MSREAVNAAATRPRPVKNMYLLCPLSPPMEAYARETDRGIVSVNI